jgi:hypothetical protein
VALARKRTIPTERPPLDGEVSDNFCGYPNNIVTKHGVEITGKYFPLSYVLLGTCTSSDDLSKIPLFFITTPSAPWGQYSRPCYLWVKWPKLYSDAGAAFAP